MMKRNTVWIMAVTFMLLCTACAGQNAETEGRENAVSLQETENADTTNTAVEKKHYQERKMFL